MKYMLVLFLIVSQAHAVSFQKAPRVIAKHVAAKLNRAQQAFSLQNRGTYIHASEDQSAYYLKRIRLQYAPFVAFDVAFFEMKIIPILEFRWTRKNPMGWINYRRN
jgi:hypothetical protein